MNNRLIQLVNLEFVQYQSHIHWQDLDLKQRPLLLVRKDESDDKGNKNNGSGSNRGICS